MKRLPQCFAFKNSGKHPRKEEIKKRFNEMGKKNWSITSSEIYYGRNGDHFLRPGEFDWHISINSFGASVIEITEDDFLEMTEPELTKLPENFYFKYVDEKDRELLKERFNATDSNPLSFDCIGGYYGVDKYGWFCKENAASIFDSTEITQQDFIRLTEPAQSPYKGDIKDFPKEVVEWMLDNQVKQGNKRDVSIFEKRKSAGYYDGGFNWKNAIEGNLFCDQVIMDTNFSIFFEKYPNYTSPQPIPLTGKIIEISERGILISLTEEQIKSLNIFEEVTITK